MKGLLITHNGITYVVMDIDGFLLAVPTIEEAAELFLAFTSTQQQLEEVNPRVFDYPDFPEALKEYVADDKGQNIFGVVYGMRMVEDISDLKPVSIIKEILVGTGLEA